MNTLFAFVVADGAHGMAAVRLAGKIVRRRHRDDAALFRAVVEGLEELDAEDDGLALG